MSQKFIHKALIDETFTKRDNRFALAALVTESLAVYYWCEAFAEGRPMRFCIIGQRGLAEYAAKASVATLQLVEANRQRMDETEGFAFGAVIALREALRLRRYREQRKPEYMDQCNVSTYRAKHTVDKYYKVGVKDVTTQFDVEGYQRGFKQQWSLLQFKDPIKVLDEYSRLHV